MTEQKDDIISDDHQIKILQEILKPKLILKYNIYFLKLIEKKNTTNKAL